MLTVQQNCLSFAKELLFYLEDIFDISNSPDFDEGVFQVYQTVGRSMVTHTFKHDAPQSLSARMAHDLSLKLDTFNSSWQLYSGLRMEQLWQIFRPAVASSLPQLECSLRVKELADRFDALKWSSGSSVQELDILRSSIVRIHDSITATSSRQFEPLEVSKLLPE